MTTTTGISGDRRGAAAVSPPPSARRPARRPALFGLRAPISETKQHTGVQARDATGRRLLVVADLLAAAIALFGCLTVIGDDSLRVASLLALPVAVLTSKIIGLYDRDELVLRKSTLDEAPALFQLATLYAFLVWLLEGVLVDGALGRVQVLGLWGTLFVSVLFARRFARVVSYRISGLERCLVIGDEETSERMRAKLDESSALRGEVVARMPFVGKRAEDHSRRDRTWTVEDMNHIASRFDIHRVVLAPSSDHNDELLELTRVAKAIGLKVTVVPRMFEVVGSQFELDDLDGIAVLGVPRFELSRSSRVLKRSLDIVGAGAATIAFAPLMVVTALAIRLDSKGPALFRQIRVGRDGAQFELIKFRTMSVDAEARKEELQELNEADGLFKIADDPRVTRVGRFLRRTSLDELPQLLNVLRGEMSLVGPRPLVIEDDKRVEGWHRRRLHLTPGMTGQWQILGSARIPLREMVKIDYLYVASWSLWRDLKILIRTVPYMLARRGQ